jgi:hypothetical protein
MMSLEQLQKELTAEEATTVSNMTDGVSNSNIFLKFTIDHHYGRKV